MAQKVGGRVPIRESLRVEVSLGEILNLELPLSVCVCATVRQGVKVKKKCLYECECDWVTEDCRKRCLEWSASE